MNLPRGDFGTYRNGVTRRCPRFYAGSSGPAPGLFQLLGANCHREMAQARDYLFSDGEWKNVSSIDQRNANGITTGVKDDERRRNHDFGGSPQSK